MDLLKETLHPSSSRREFVGLLVDSPGRQIPQTCVRLLPADAETKCSDPKPLLFDTFDLDGDNTTKLFTCRLQYGTGFYPELDYDDDFKLRILNDLINFR